MNQILPVRWKLTTVTLRLSKAPFPLLEKIGKPETRTNEAISTATVRKSAHPATAMTPKAVDRNEPTVTPNFLITVYEMP
jgi:hypothetical protein